MGKATPMLQFLGEDDIAPVLAEVHKGAYNSHIGIKAPTPKLLGVGYYWPI